MMKSGDTRERHLDWKNIISIFEWEKPTKTSVLKISITQN